MNLGGEHAENTVKTPRNTCKPRLSQPWGQMQAYKT
jgi:hypothetical protein